MYFQVPRIASLLLVSAGLTFPACGGNEGFLGEEPTLTGQIDAWNHRTGFTLQARVPRGATAEEFIPIASSPIDADGNFSLTLPGSAVMTPFLRQTTVSSPPTPGCMGSIQPAKYEYYAESALFFAVRGSITLPVAMTNGVPEAADSTQVRAYYSYIDRETYSSGTVTCPANVFGVETRAKVDLHIQPGWNRQSASWTRDSASRIVEGMNSSGSLPTGVKWLIDETEP